MRAWRVMRVAMCKLISTSSLAVLHHRLYSLQNVPLGYTIYGFTHLLSVRYEDVCSVWMHATCTLLVVELNETGGHTNYLSNSTE